MQYAIELYYDKKMSGEFVAIGLVKISFPVEKIYTVELEKWYIL